MTGDHLPARPDNAWAASPARILGHCVVVVCAIVAIVALSERPRASAASLSAGGYARLVEGLVIAAGAWSDW